MRPIQAEPEKLEGSERDLLAVMLTEDMVATTAAEAVPARTRPGKGAHSLASSRAPQETTTRGSGDQRPCLRCWCGKIFSDPSKRYVSYLLTSLQVQATHPSHNSYQQLPGKLPRGPTNVGSPRAHGTLCLTHGSVLECLRRHVGSVMLFSFMHLSSSAQLCMTIRVELLSSHVQRKYSHLCQTSNVALARHLFSVSAPCTLAKNVLRCASCAIA